MPGYNLYKFIFSTSPAENQYCGQKVLFVGQDSNPRPAAFVFVLPLSSPSLMKVVSGPISGVAIVKATNIVHSLLAWSLS